MRDSATPPSSPTLLKDALWYAAAAGAVGALAPSADAQIVYTDLDPDAFITDTEVGGDGTFTGFSVDFDGDGDTELLLFEEDGRDYTRFAYDFDPTDGPDAITGIVGELIPFGGGGTYLYASPLAVGSTIGPGPSLVTATAYTYGTFTFQGSDPEGWIGIDAYVGVQFTLDGASTHYGWIHMEIPASGGSMVVKEYAYEASPDTPIEAGATGTAIEPGPDGLPGTHNLSALYPNPFRDQATIQLEIAEQQNVRVAVYDALGRAVATLHDGTLSASSVHAFTLDGADLPSGIYLVRATGEQFADVRTITLAK